MTGKWGNERICEGTGGEREKDREAEKAKPKKRNK